MARIADVSESDGEYNFCTTTGGNVTAGKWVIDSGATCHMTHRRDVFSTADVIGETGREIGMIRSEYIGGEYIDGKFKRHLRDNLIQCQNTTAGKHEQNGVAERHNRTLTEKHAGTLWAQ